MEAPSDYRSHFYIEWNRRVIIQSVSHVLSCHSIITCFIRLYYYALVLLVRFVCIGNFPTIHINHECRCEYQCVHTYYTIQAYSMKTRKKKKQTNLLADDRT